MKLTWGCWMCCVRLLTIRNLCCITVYLEMMQAKWSFHICKAMLVLIHLNNFCLINYLLGKTLSMRTLFYYFQTIKVNSLSTLFNVLLFPYGYIHPMSSFILLFSPHFFSPSSNPLRFSLSVSSPLSLHHPSLPPSGVTARWLQVAREGGRKGCRVGWMEGGMEDKRGMGCHLFLCSYHHSEDQHPALYFPQSNCSWISVSILSSVSSR